MLGAPACFIFLLCQLTGPAASGIPKKLVGAIGGSVIFPLNLSVNLVDSIIWVFNSTTLITIQPKTGSIIVTQKRNKERVNFPHEGYSLKLSRLKKNDSGIYRVEIHSSTLQEPLTQEYELRVYEFIEEKKELDTHQETLPFPSISEEMPEYDTISYFNNTIPEENPANTVYSTVHIPPKVTEPHSLPMSSDTPRSSTYKNVV
uniref:SLAM family member 7 n=1 Tax=Moschus moschiferus TaxID=68415 RepID=A0A8C6MIL4_MOSMO